MTKRLAGKLALITGASRGIGRAVARGFAGEGAHVVLLARSIAALEDLDDEIKAAGGAATLVKLDLRKGDQVDALGPSLYQRWGKLDILVANAGTLGPLSPIGHVTSEAWADVMETNVNANFRLIRTLDPLLRRAEAGRAVFVTSGAASASMAYWGPYATAKAALDALVKSWARELDTTPVRANLLSPGPVRTAMRAKAFPGEDPMTLPAPEELLPLFLELVAPELATNGEIFRFRRTSA